MAPQSIKATVEELKAQLVQLESKMASELEHGASMDDEPWHVVTPSVVAGPPGSITVGDQSTSQNQMT